MTDFNYFLEILFNIKYQFFEIRSSFILFIYLKPENVFFFSDLILEFRYKIAHFILWFLIKIYFEKTVNFSLSSSFCFETFEINIISFLNYEKKLINSNYFFWMNAEM